MQGKVPDEVLVCAKHRTIWQRLCEAYTQNGEQPLTVAVCLQIVRECSPNITNAHGVLYRLDNAGLLTHVPGKRTHRLRIPVFTNVGISTQGNRKQRKQKRVSLKPALSVASKRIRRVNSPPLTGDESGPLLFADQSLVIKLGRKAARIYEALMAVQREMGYRVPLSYTEIQELIKQHGITRDILDNLKNMYGLIHKVAQKERQVHSKFPRLVVFAPYQVCARDGVQTPKECLPVEIKPVVSEPETIVPMANEHVSSNGSSPSIRSLMDLMRERELLQGAALTRFQTKLDTIKHLLPSAQADLRTYQETVDRLRSELEEAIDISALQQQRIMEMEEWLAQASSGQIPDYTPEEQERMAALNMLIANYADLSKCFKYLFE